MSVIVKLVEISAGSDFWRHCVVVVVVVVVFVLVVLVDVVAVVAALAAIAAVVVVVVVAVVAVVVVVVVVIVAIVILMTSSVTLKQRKSRRGAGHRTESLLLKKKPELYRHVGIRLCSGLARLG